MQNFEGGQAHSKLMIPFLLQNQVRRPAGERFAHQGCRERNVRRPGCGEIKNLRSIRAHTRERDAGALHQDLRSSFINILLEEFPRAIAVGGEKRPPYYPTSMHRQCCRSRPESGGEALSIGGCAHRIWQ